MPRSSVLALAALLLSCGTNPGTPTGPEQDGLLSHGAPSGGMSRMPVWLADSGLNDCDIPFQRLRAEAPSCRRGQRVSDRRCEQYSPSQFSEVVSIYRADTAVHTAEQICSGTVIAPNWVVAAAHCVVGTVGAAELAGTAGADQVISDAALRVGAPWALLAQEEDRVRRVQRAIVYRGYAGEPDFQGDLALLELDRPFPEFAVQPAVLVPEGGAAALSTGAGYGVSNADGGTVNQFNVFWPLPLAIGSHTLTFTPTDGSAFCKGDSGGPIFAGRYRGCRPNQAGGEPRPRVLQGVISAFNFDGRTTPAVSAMEWASVCMRADLMIATSLAAGEHRTWVCSITDRKVGGC